MAEGVVLAKPDGCHGCPFYGDGRGFVPDEIVEGAKVFVVGQNPGSDEEREGRPFAGKTGQTMEREFFPTARLIRGENASLGNILKCRQIVNGKRTNDLPSGRLLDQTVQHCMKAHFRVPSSTKLLLAQGAVAWAALGGPGNISDWRGYLAPEGYEDGKSVDSD